MITTIIPIYNLSSVIPIIIPLLFMDNDGYSDALPFLDHYSLLLFFFLLFFQQRVVSLLLLFILLPNNIMIVVIFKEKKEK